MHLSSPLLTLSPPLLSFSLSLSLTLFLPLPLSLSGFISQSWACRSFKAGNRFLLHSAGIYHWASSCLPSDMGGIAGTGSRRSILIIKAGNGSDHLTMYVLCPPKYADDYPLSLFFLILSGLIKLKLSSDSYTVPDTVLFLQSWQDVSLGEDVCLLLSVSGNE